MVQLGRSVVAAALLSVALAVSAQAQGVAPAAKKHQVLFQVSEADPAKWEMTLNNVKNIQKDLGQANIDVEIVAYGPGIDMFKLESTVGSRVADALKQGVKVMICENTLHGQKLTHADMLDNLGYVQAGVSEIILRQEQGYSYIRP